MSLKEDKKNIYKHKGLHSAFLKAVFSNHFTQCVCYTVLVDNFFYLLTEGKKTFKAPI